MIRLGGLWICHLKHISCWVMRTIPRAAGGQGVELVLLLTGVTSGSVWQLCQARLKCFDTTSSLPKLQRPLWQATQLLPVGPTRHISFICIPIPQKWDFGSEAAFITPSVNVGLLQCWHRMQGFGVTIIWKEILALLNQRVLTEVFSSQVERLQSDAAAAKEKQKHRLCR